QLDRMSLDQALRSGLCSNRFDGACREAEERDRVRQGGILQQDPTTTQPSHFPRAITGLCSHTVTGERMATTSGRVSEELVTTVAGRGNNAHRPGRCHQLRKSHTPPLWGVLRCDV